MRTVLFVETTHVAVGGVGARHSRLAALLPTRGWRPVFALTWGRRFHDPARFTGNLSEVESILLDGRTGTQDGRRLALRKCLGGVRPDVVLPGAVADAFAAVEEEKAGKRGPRLVYELPGIAVAPLAFVAAHRAMVDGAFGVSPMTAHLLRAVCGLPPERVHLVTTGVAPPTRPPAGGGAGSLRLGYVGRFDSDKQALDIGLLCDELVARGVDFRFRAVGSGTYERDLRGVAERLGGRLEIVAPMPTSRLYEEVYPGLDALLLFSPIEGLPNAVLEAMSHGVVPVTSDYRGRREQGLPLHDVNGLVFSVGDLRGAADQIVRLSEDVTLRRRLGAAAREEVSSKHSLDAMADSFVSVLEHTLSMPPRLGETPAVDDRSQSRLRRILRPEGAELARRILRRRFAHRDASEWPLTDNSTPPNLGEIEALIGAEVERVNQGPPQAHSDRHERATR